MQELAAASFWAAIIYFWLSVLWFLWVSDDDCMFFEVAPQFWVISLGTHDWILALQNAFSTLTFHQGDSEAKNQNMKICPKCASSLNIRLWALWATPCGLLLSRLWVKKKTPSSCLHRTPWDVPFNKNLLSIQPELSPGAWSFLAKKIFFSNRGTTDYKASLFNHCGKHCDKTMGMYYWLKNIFVVFQRIWGIPPSKKDSVITITTFKKKHITTISIKIDYYGGWWDKGLEEAEAEGARARWC